MSYEVFYNKYKNFNPATVLLDELKVDVYENIKPTSIPEIDFCMIKMVGDVSNELVKYNKWQKSRGLTDDIISFTFKNYPLLPINIDDITKIIEETKAKNQDPATIDLKITKVIKTNISDFLENTKNNEGYGVLMDTYFKYRNNFSEILVKYNLEWKEIENETKEIEELVLKIFEPFTEDPNFIATFEVIEDIATETKDKIESLIKKILVDYENERQEQNCNDNNNDNDNDKFNRFLDIFETEMNKIYEKSIKSRKFSQQITDMLIEVYKVDKEMHKLALSIEFTNNLLSKLK
jgi:hypothetical protein